MDAYTTGTLLAVLDTAVIHRSSFIIAILVVLGSAGCIGDPDVEGVRSSLVLVEVERTRWEPAPPGCEGQSVELGLRICEGAPSLGALVDSEERVVCVDSLALLAEERQIVGGGVFGGDPSPQPNRPPPPELYTR